MDNGTDSSHPLPRNVVEAIQRGNLIEAIKRLRQQTGLGLKEAKELVDAQVRGNGTAGRGVAAAALPASVASALQQGNTIEAIRLLRKETGLGLKEARQRIEASLLSPGEVRRSHTGLVLLVALTIVAGIVVYLVFQHAAWSALMGRVG